MQCSTFVYSFPTFGLLHQPRTYSKTQTGGRVVYKLCKLYGDGDGDVDGDGDGDGDGGGDGDYSAVEN